MAEINFDLSALFEKIWGYKSNAFNPDFNKLPARQENGFASPYYGKDYFGNEYFLPVTMTYVVNGVKKTWDLPYPIVSIDSKKHWVETPLTERSGTVKQYINTGDYEIRVKGFIIAPTNDFPEEDLMTMRELYECNAGVSLSSALTDIFLLRPDRSGSDDVVIKAMSLPAVKGIKNIKPYELTFTSDAPFNLVDLS